MTNYQKQLLGIALIVTTAIILSGLIGLWYQKATVQYFQDDTPKSPENETDDTMTDCDEDSIICCNCTNEWTVIIYNSTSSVNQTFWINSTTIYCLNETCITG
jgi:hypothetical protein